MMKKVVLIVLYGFILTLSANDDFFRVVSGGALQGNMLANDTGGNELLSISTPSRGGVVSLNSSGDFTYEADTSLEHASLNTCEYMDYSGNIVSGASYCPPDGYDYFYYLASDGKGGQARARVQIAIGDANEPPHVSDRSYSVNENSSLQENIFKYCSISPFPAVPRAYSSSSSSSSEVSSSSFSSSSSSSSSSCPLNRIDSDGDVISVAGVTLPTDGGTVSIDSDGNFTYTPPFGFSGYSTFDVTLTDGHGGSSLMTVTINVIPSPEHNIPNPDGSGNGDGNLDGIDDALQLEVQSQTIWRYMFDGDFGTYSMENWLSVAVEDLTNASVTPTVSTIENIDYPEREHEFGELRFQICGLTAGDEVRVEVFLMDTDRSSVNQLILENTLGELKQYPVKIVKVGNALKLTFTVEDGSDYDRDDNQNGCIDIWMVPAKKSLNMAPILLLLGL